MDFTKKLLPDEIPKEMQREQKYISVTAENLRKIAKEMDDEIWGECRISLSERLEVVEWLISNPDLMILLNEKCKDLGMIEMTPGYYYDINLGLEDRLKRFIFVDYCCSRDGVYESSWKSTIANSLWEKFPNYNYD